MADFATLFNVSPQGTEAGWSFRTGRVRIDPSVIGVDAVSFRLTFRAGYGRMVVPSVFIGVEKPYYGPYGYMFDAAPTPVTFGGGAGFDIAGGATITSDEIFFKYKIADWKALIVSFFAATATGSITGDYAYSDAVSGVNTKYLNGPDRAGAMQAELGGAWFYFNAHRVYGLSRVEYVAADTIVTEPTGDITGAGDVYLTSEDEVFIAGQQNTYDPEIGASFAFDYSINYGADISKLSLYVVTRVRDPFVSKLSLYVVTNSNISIFNTFDYYIGKIDVPFSFDYTVQAARMFPFDYRIIGAATKDFTFDYQIAVVNADFTFDYRVFGSILREFGFNYSIIEIGREYIFDYNINYHPPQYVSIDYRFAYAIDSPRVPVILVPEVPITETWVYASAFVKNYDGTEQRATLRDEPVSIYGYDYVFDKERAELYREIFDRVRTSLMLPIYAYASVLKESAEFTSTLVLNPDTGDIRAGDEVLCLTPDEEYLTATVASVGTDDITLYDAIADFLPAGTWVVPMREVYIADDNGISMRSIAGQSRISYTTATRRAIKRPGVAGGVVPTYDDIPLLDKRPLADDDVNEMFAGSTVRITDAVDVGVASVATWKMPTINGARSFLVDRMTEMDFWREFADTTKGRRGSFLMPTFRADLTPVSVSGVNLRVAGVHFAAWAKHDSYARLRLETSAGVVYRKVMAAVRDGGETVITLDSAPPGVVERVSFLNRVRLASDAFKWQHIETQSMVTIEVVTVNE